MHNHQQSLAEVSAVTWSVLVNFLPWATASCASASAALEVAGIEHFPALLRLFLKIALLFGQQLACLLHLALLTWSNATAV